MASGKVECREVAQLAVGTAAATRLWRERARVTRSSLPRTEVEFRSSNRCRQRDFRVPDWRRAASRASGFGGSGGVPRTTIRHISRKTPAVRSALLQPGAPNASVATAQPTRRSNAPTIPRSMIDPSVARSIFPRSRSVEAHLSSRIISSNMLVPRRREASSVRGLSTFRRRGPPWLQPQRSGALQRLAAARLRPLGS